MEDKYKYISDLEDWFLDEWLHGDRQKAYMLDKVCTKMKNRILSDKKCSFRYNSFTGLFDYI